MLIFIISIVPTSSFDSSIFAALIPLSVAIKVISGNNEFISLRVPVNVKVNPSGLKLTVLAGPERLNLRFSKVAVKTAVNVLLVAMY